MAGLGGPRIILSALFVLLASYPAYFFYEIFTSYMRAPILIFSNDTDVSNSLLDLGTFSTLPYHGCESMVYHDGAIYTGAVEGKILKLNDSGIHVLAQLGSNDCKSPHACGRPLGMRLLEDENNLIVADAFLGLFSVSLTDGTHRKLFPLDTKFEITFFNDFDILPNGTIILSESSTEFSLENIMNVVYSENPSGRILSIDPKTGEWRELMTGLAFANGVQLHRDGKSVLVAETVTRRVYRLPLDGGPPSLFIDLPGMPDNIRSSPRGGYWVPVGNVRDTFFAHLSEHTRQWSIVKKMVVLLSKIPFFERIRFTKSAMLLRLNDDGKVIEVLRDPTNRVRNVAEVCEQGNRIYTGTYFLPHIGHMQL